MDNTMDIHLEGTHSRESLSFNWLAIFSDSSYINQFEGKIEHKFQEVIDRFADLKYFILHHKTEHKKFIVDLEKGLIYLNKPVISFAEAKIKQNIRLIYFRRNRIELNAKDLKEKSRVINYFLGFQYLNEKNENCKVLLEIDNEGNMVIGE